MSLTLFRGIERLSPPSPVDSPIAEGDRVDEALNKLQGQIDANGAGAFFVIAPEYPIAPFRLISVSENGNAEYASADNFAHIGKVVGVSVDSVVTVQQLGLVENPAWSFEGSGPVFLGINGFFTQDGNAGVFAQIVGSIVSPTKIILNLGTPVRRA